LRRKTVNQGGGGVADFFVITDHTVYKGQDVSSSQCHVRLHMAQTKIWLPIDGGTGVTITPGMKERNVTA
jgi:hypothetical protein